MSREEIIAQHESVKNIERLSANINVKQGIVIICVIASIISWWFLGKAKDHDSNNDVKIQLIELNHLIKDQAKNDSINNILMNNKIDNSNKQSEAHFMLIEERMKHFKQLGTGMITGDGIIGVTERKDRFGNMYLSGIK